MSRSASLTAAAANRCQPGYSAYNLNATAYQPSARSGPRRAAPSVPTPISPTLSRPAGPANRSSFGSLELALCLHARTENYPSAFVQHVPAVIGSWDHYLRRGSSLKAKLGTNCTSKEFGCVNEKDKKLLFFILPVDSTQHRQVNAVMNGCQLRLLNFTIELKFTAVASSNQLSKERKCQPCSLPERKASEIATHVLLGLLYGTPVHLPYVAVICVPGYCCLKAASETWASGVRVVCVWWQSVVRLGNVDRRALDMAAAAQSPVRSCQ
ncbi:hypothetical protein NBRC10512_006099 [Rhodotorula toruloides]